MLGEDGMHGNNTCSIMVVGVQEFGNQQFPDLSKKIPNIYII